jgi:peptidoglycan hydrolase-like protein with peptidoglycan-binding domain
VWGKRSIEFAQHFTPKRVFAADNLSRAHYVELLTGRSAMQRRVLRRESPMMTGEVVRLAQRHLIALGFGQAGAPDGKFGRNSERAVHAFQRDRGLQQTGAVDAATWREFEDERRCREADFPQPLTPAVSPASPRREPGSSSRL